MRASYANPQGIAAAGKSGRQTIFARLVLLSHKYYHSRGNACERSRESPESLYAKIEVESFSILSVFFWHEFRTCSANNVWKTVFIVRLALFLMEMCGLGVVFSS